MCLGVDSNACCQAMFYDPIHANKVFGSARAKSKRKDVVEVKKKMVVMGLNEKQKSSAPSRGLRKRKGKG